MHSERPERRRIQTWWQIHGPAARGHATWLVPLTVYAVALILVSWRHELWRDEVRPLGIVAASPTPWALVENLHNEGHPLLWYVLLWFASAGGWLPWMLKPLAIGVAVASAYLFLRHAPWPAWMRVLFLFGLFPFYEDGVMCRSYGISLLCLIIVCMRWPARWSRPFGLGAALALLANTNAHSLLVVAALLVALGLELVIRRRWRDMDRRGLVSLAAALGLVLLAALAAALVMRPDATTIIRARSVPPTSIQIVQALVGFLDDPVRTCPQLVGVVADDPRGTPGAVPEVLGDVGAAALGLFAVALLVCEWPLAVAGVLALGAASVFNDFVYGMHTRHHGIIYVFLVALAWLATAAVNGKAPSTTKAGAAVARRAAAGVRAVLAVVFVVQICAAWPPVARDWHRSMSSSARLGQLLESDPALRDAIILGEPDYLLEVLPYYAPHARIYLSREQRFMPGRTSFTAANKQASTLNELLDDAQAQRRTTGKAVVLVMGASLHLAPGGNFQVTHGFAKKFSYDLASFQRLQTDATVIANLSGAIGDENYTVYQLR